jgi:hypothetical protein
VMSLRTYGRYDRVGHDREAEGGVGGREGRGTSSASQMPRFREEPVRDVPIRRERSAAARSPAGARSADVVGTLTERDACRVGRQHPHQGDLDQGLEASPRAACVSTRPTAAKTAPTATTGRSVRSGRRARGGREDDPTGTTPR